MKNDKTVVVICLGNILHVVSFICQASSHSVCSTLKVLDHYISWSAIITYSNILNMFSKGFLVVCKYTLHQREEIH